MIRFIVAVLVSAFWLCVSISAQKPDSVAAPPPPPPPSPPVSYGLVVDNSGSFRLLLDQVITVVSEVVESHGADDEAFLVTFVDNPKIVLRQELTSSKSELHDAINNMFIEGGQTTILDAMKSSADYLAENGNNAPARLKSLVLVTDGEDRESKVKIDDLLPLLQKNKIRVFVIAISDTRVVTKMVSRLAKESGGAIFLPKNRGEVKATAKEVAAAIRK